MAGARHIYATNSAVTSRYAFSAYSVGSTGGLAAVEPVTLSSEVAIGLSDRRLLLTWIYYRLFRRRVGLTGH